MNQRRCLTRRDFLRTSGFGVGGLVLACLLAGEGVAIAESGADPADLPQDLRPRQGHFPARARAMVHFMQNGGPSQMDLFDPKPELQKRAGQSIPQSVEIYQKGNTDKILGSPLKFSPRGKCGIELSDAMPHL